MQRSVGTEDAQQNVTKAASADAGTQAATAATATAAGRPALLAHAHAIAQRGSSGSSGSMVGRGVVGETAVQDALNGTSAARPGRSSGMRGGGSWARIRVSDAQVQERFIV